MHVGHTELSKPSVCKKSFQLIYTMATQFKPINNNNDNDRKLAAQFLQRQTIHKMLRKCIAAIAVMVSIYHIISLCSTRVLYS